MGPGGKGFAIPINDAIGVVGQIRAGVPSDTVHIGPPVLLGVGVRTAPRDEARRADRRSACVAVRRTRPGLIDGDLITVLDGITLDSTTTLTSVLDRHYPGDVVDLTWIDSSGADADRQGDAGPGVN